jgi:hypothetical protein
MPFFCHSTESRFTEGRGIKIIDGLLQIVRKSIIAQLPVQAKRMSKLNAFIQ